VRPHEDADPFPSTHHQMEKLLKKHGPPQIKGNWSADFKDFVSRCLKMKPSERAKANELILHDFVKGGQNHQAHFQQKMATIKTEMDKEKSENKGKDIECMMRENENLLTKKAQEKFLCEAAERQQADD
jgi:serine/threonine protein kinase